MLNLRLSLPYKLIIRNRLDLTYADKESFLNTASGKYHPEKMSYPQKTELYDDTKTLLFNFLYQETDHLG